MTTIAREFVVFSCNMIQQCFPGRPNIRLILNMPWNTCYVPVFIYYNYFAPPSTRSTTGTRTSLFASNELYVQALVRKAAHVHRR